MLRVEALSSLYRGPKAVMRLVTPALRGTTTFRKLVENGLKKLGPMAPRLF